MIHLYTDQVKELNTPVSCEKPEDKEMRIVKASEICMQVSGKASSSFYENGAVNSQSDILKPDFRNNKDYLCVMANTMSEEDYAELLKDGHKPADTKPEESVNTLDRIKAKLAESGVIIEGYNDDLSIEKIEEIIGSRAAAEALVKEFSERDLTLSKENIEEISSIFEKASEVTEISDGMCDYILRNAIEPTIENLYRVRFCAAEVPFKESGYFTDAMGYKVKDAEGGAGSSEDFVRKIEKYAEELGIENKEELLEEADWLVRSKILCNAANLKALHDLRSLKMPASYEETAKAVANSFERGFDAKKADFSNTENLYEKAANTVKDINSFSSVDVKKTIEGNLDFTFANLKDVQAQEYGGSVTDDNPEFVKRERILQETRLRMTFEASYRLVKQGIAIEKAALEETVNTLKALEDRVNKEYFGNSDYKLKGELYKESRKVIAEMPYIPVKAVGDAIKSGSAFTLRLTYETGIILKEQFEKVQKDYETVGTQIRGDFGDSIKKTFEDAYRVLEDENLENNETYKKAVRILGYSEIELTKENIEEAALKESALERVIGKMTPAAVLRMIRENVNPLETSMEELEIILDGYDGEALSSVDNYARFLCKLENKKEITPEERDSFIGINRLLNQIARSDGSALGSLMKADAQINFKNLLTAIRTGKSSGINYKADASLGEVIKGAGYSFDISEQIMTAYDSFTREESDAYFKEEYAEYKNLLNKENGEAAKELEAMGEEPTPANLTAMSGILFDRKEYNPWKKFIDFSDKTDGNEFTKASLKIAEVFDDKESVEAAYNDAIKEAEEGLKQISESDITSYVNLKAIKTAFRQIGLITKMTAEENYEVPIRVEDEILNIRLKVTHKSEKEGKVFASFEDKVFGKILAQFGLNNGVVSGLVAAENRVGLEKLKGDDNFEENFAKAGFEKVTINYLQTDIINEDYFRQHFKENKSDEVTTGELYRIAKTFIETVKKAGR